MGSSSRILQAFADAAVSVTKVWGADGAAVFVLDGSGVAVARAASGSSPRGLADFAGHPETDLGPMLAGEARRSRVIHVGAASAEEAPRAAIVVFFGADACPPEDRELGGVLEALWRIAAIQLVDEASKAPPELERRSPFGRMASGIAHDFKNVLNPLAIQVQLLARAFKRARIDEALARDAGEAIQEMHAVLKRGAESLDALHELGRRGVEPSRARLELEEVAREALGRARAAADRSVVIREAYAPAPPVAGKAAELSLAIELILTRAIRVTPIDAEILLATGGGEGGAWVRVADRGPTLAEELRAHAFEPFALPVTEDPTGLGLARVHACACRHGGRVTFTSCERGGSEVAIWFPAVPARIGTP